MERHEGERSEEVGPPPDLAEILRWLKEKDRPWAWEVHRRAAASARAEHEALAGALAVADCGEPASAALLAGARTVEENYRRVQKELEDAEAVAGETDVLFETWLWICRPGVPLGMVISELGDWERLEGASWS